MTAADLELDDTAARALASIILERTADALAEGGIRAGDALQAMAEDAAIVLDVAAAILFATTWLAGAGEVAPEAIFAASISFLPDDDTGLPLSPVVASEGPAAGSVDDEATEPVNGPQTAVQPDIQAIGDQVVADHDEMVAEAIRRATAALAAPGVTDASEG